MINPTECAKRIVLNDNPAKELFDLLLWTAEQPDIKDNEEYQEIMGDLWKRLPEGQDAREAYAQSRLHRADLRIQDVSARTN